MTLVWIGGMGYHLECTRPLGWEAPTFKPLTATHYTVPMSDDRVRLIVRDELQRAGLFERLKPPNV